MWQRLPNLRKQCRFVPPMPIGAMPSQSRWVMSILRTGVAHHSMWCSAITPHRWLQKCIRAKCWSFCQNDQADCLRKIRIFFLGEFQSGGDFASAISLLPSSGGRCGPGYLVGLPDGVALVEIVFQLERVARIHKGAAQPLGFCFSPCAGMGVDSALDSSKHFPF